MSPHLQVYRWQITMTMSILHRASGVLLALGALLLVAWLLALAAGPEAFAQVSALVAGPLGKLVLLGLGAALSYHLLNGIRHLLWDVGYGYEIPKLYATGWTVLVLAALLVAGLAWAMFARGGVA